MVEMDGRFWSSLTTPYSDWQETGLGELAVPETGKHLRLCGSVWTGLTKAARVCVHVCDKVVTHSSKA